MRFLISAHRSDATTSVHVSGEIDLTSESQLRTAMVGALRDDVTKCLVIDLTGVTFLDCTGISALVYGRRLAGERGCDYQIRGARGMPLTLLRMTGVGQ